MAAVNGPDSFSPSATVANRYRIALQAGSKAIRPRRRESQLACRADARGADVSTSLPTSRANQPRGLHQFRHSNVRMHSEVDAVGRLTNSLEARTNRTSNISLTHKCILAESRCAAGRLAAGPAVRIEIVSAVATARIESVANLFIDCLRSERCLRSVIARRGRFRQNHGWLSRQGQSRNHTWITTIGRAITQRRSITVANTAAGPKGPCRLFKTWSTRKVKS